MTLLLAVIAAQAAPAYASPDPLKPVLVDLGGVLGDADSVGTPALSADGGIIAFASYASNLAEDDANRVADIFVFDRATRRSDRVSVASGGAEADRSSGEPALSADGRFVTFVSNATNLVADDTNRKADVFVHDRRTGVTERVSVDSDENQADWLPSGAPTISADGRFVAFESNASDLVPNDSNRLTDAGTPGDVFVRDRMSGTTERVSVDSSGREVRGISGTPSMSASGRYVVFESNAPDLAPRGTGAERRVGVFLNDRLTGDTSQVDVSNSGRQADAFSGRPAISGNGRVVVFRSAAANLVPGTPGDGTPRLYARDLRRATTELVSDALSGAAERAAVSGDGTIVALTTTPPVRPPAEPQPVGDVIVVDRPSDSVERVLRPAGGGVADPAGSGPALSADGRAMAFVSRADDLSADDTNGAADVFLAGLPRAGQVLLEPVPELAPTAFRLWGAGFSANEPIEVRFDGVLIATRHANAFGAPIGRVRVPANAPPGSHRVSLTGTRSGATAESSVLLGPPM